MADNELRRRRLKIIQVLLLVDELEEGKGRNRERIISTRIWIRRREERGVYHELIRELALDDVALKQTFSLFTVYLSLTTSPTLVCNKFELGLGG